MCDFPGRLVAWLDGELPECEAAEVQRHVQNCAECRSRIESYERVSKGGMPIARSGGAEGASRSGPVETGPVGSSGGGDCASYGVSARAGRADLGAGTSGRCACAPRCRCCWLSSRVFEAAPASEKKIHRRRAAVPEQIQNTNWVAAEPGIQIAIPADAMFPPGAVPEGINFVAEVSIAPDGSAQGLRLQPRLDGMERRSTQP